MPSSRPTDIAAEQLFRAVRERDDRALAEFMRRLSPWLAAEVRRAGAKGSEIDEVVQDTWVAAIAAVDEFRAHGALLPWLAAVARHRVVSLRRSQRRRARLHAESGEALRSADAGLPDVLTLVRGREALLAVRQAVEDQPAPYREVLRLHLFEGLPPHAIAERLRLGRVGVRVRLYRALRRLRKALPDALALVLLAALTRRGASQAPIWLGAAATVAIGGAACWYGVVVMAPPAIEAAERRVAVEPSVEDRGAVDLPALPSVDIREPALAPDQVSVRVVDASGQPLPGVGVTLAPLAGFDPLLSERRLCTDANGLARFVGAPSGRLSARSDRGASTTIEPGCREVVLRTVAGIEVRGRVVDPAGAAIAAARIWLAGPGSQRRDGEEVAVTAADGSFVLRAVAPGSSLAVRAEGRAGVRLRTIRDGELGNVVLHARGGAAAVEVVWADGGSVPEATVVLGHADIGTLPNDESPALMPPFVARSDRAGRWSVNGVEPGFLPLVVRAPGAAPFCTTIAITADTETAVRVSLQRGSSLTGRIVDRDGRAVAGARIACRSDATFSAVDSRSADDGTFCFASLPIGDIGLLVWAADCQVVEQVFALGREPMTVEVQVDPRPRRRGRLLTMAGEPLAGWELSLPLPNARSVEDGSIEVAADAAGAIEFAPAAGADWQRLVMRPPTSIFWALVGDLREELPDGSFVVRVPPDMCTAARLRGRILTDSGEPIANATMVVYGNSHSRLAVGSSDADGRFEYGPLPAGDYQLSVEAPHAGMPAMDLPQVSLEDGELAILDVVAPATGRLHFGLQFASGQRPHAPVISISSRDSKRHRAELFGATGEQVLVPGEYSLSAMGDDFVWRTESFVVRAGERTELVMSVIQAAHRQFSLRHLPVDHGGELRGRFYDAATGTTLYAFRVPLDKAFPLPLTSFLPVGSIGCEARTARGQRLRAQFEVTDLRPSFDVLELPFQLQQ